MTIFNTLFEHLFVCQTLLKERRRPPTGGLREAFEESLGGRVYCFCEDHERAYFDRVRNPEHL